MAIHVGTSGWSYAHWTGILYPDPTPPGKRLGYYLQHFQTTELNASYYRWPGDATFRGWAERLPDGFRLTVKAPGLLTHRKRLLQPENWVARIAHSVSLLGERFGVLLVQLPPQMGFDYERLAHFLRQLPTWLPVAAEFRHPSWERAEVYDLLARHQAAYCVVSGAGLPCHPLVTAPHAYVRLHGPDPHQLYHGSYTDDELRTWAGRLHGWHRAGHDVWTYFNNDPFGHAVRNALRLRELLPDLPA